MNASAARTCRKPSPESGRPPNRAFGYTATGEPLEPEATAIRTAVADVLAGKSIRRVAKEWNGMAAEPRRGGLETIRVGRTLALRKALVLALADRRRNDKPPNGISV